MEILPNGKCTNRRNQTGLIEGKWFELAVRGQWQSDMAEFSQQILCYRF